MENVDFDQLVTEAIDNIPEEFQDRLKNVVFKTEDEPTEEQRQKLGLRRCDALFGLYEGVPLTKRGGAVHSIVPDVITVFKYPMVHMHQDEASLKRQVYNTVWHEVAHFFGMNHADIHRAESRL